MILFVSGLFALFYTLLQASVAHCAEEPPPTRLDLVPIRRALSIEARDLWRRDIVPRSQVQLDYGISVYHSPSASATFTAHDGLPILVLEDLDYVVNNVDCASFPSTDRAGMMKITFNSEDTFLKALDTWSEFRMFTVVTAHPTCNADNERGAWAVQSVSGDFPTRTVELVVHSIGLHEVGHTCRIKYDSSVNRIWGSNQTTRLPKRDPQTVKNSTTGSINPQYPSRTTLFPLEAGNVTFVPQDIIDKLAGVDIQLTCVDCTFKGEFDIAVDFTVDLSGTPPQLTNATTSLTVVDFEQSASVEVYLGSEYSGEFNFSIMRAPLLPLSMLPFIEIGPAVGLEIGLGLNVSGGINFTYGAKAQIPSGTFASFNLVNDTGYWNPTFQTDGWEKTSVDQIPFRVNSGKLDMKADMFLAPYADVALEFNIASLKYGADARITQTIPKVTMDASLLTAVTRNCTSIGDNDFESFATAFAVGADMGVGTVAHFGIDTGGLSELLGFPNAYDYPFLAADLPLLPTNGSEKQECFVLVDDTPGGTPSLAESELEPVRVAGVPAATGTMFTAASAVPTWDFTKIESYYSANGHLPTNVNYQQMIKATTIPSPILQAVQSITKSSDAPRIASLNRWTLLSSALVLGVMLL